MGRTRPRQGSALPKNLDTDQVSSQLHFRSHLDQAAFTFVHRKLGQREVRVSDIYLLIDRLLALTVPSCNPKPVIHYLVPLKAVVRLEESLPRN